MINPSSNFDKKLRKLNSQLKHLIICLQSTHSIFSVFQLSPPPSQLLLFSPLPLLPCPGAVWAYRIPSRRWATLPSRSVLPPCPPQLPTSRASACLTWWWGCSTTPRTPSPGWGRVSEPHAVTSFYPNHVLHNFPQYSESYVNKL